MHLGIVYVTLFILAPGNTLSPAQTQALIASPQSHGHTSFHTCTSVSPNRPRTPRRQSHVLGTSESPRLSVAAQ